MKASKFPPAATLTLLCVVAAMALLNLVVMLHYQRAGSASNALLPYAIHYDLLDLLMLATAALAYTQWLVERRPLADFHWPTLLALAGIYLLVSGAESWLWAYASLHLGQWLGAHTSSLDTSQRLMAIAVVMLVISLVMKLLCLVLSVWAALQWLRRPGPASQAPAAGYRGRAIAILTLFAWSWALLCVEAILLASPTLMPSDAEQLMAGLPIGCLVLALPVLLGGLWALPRTLPRARPGRLLLASLLAMLLSALAMLAIGFVMLHAGQGMSGDRDFSPGLGFATLVGIVWFVACVPLAWIAVKLLFRRVPVAGAIAA